MSLAATITRAKGGDWHGQHGLIATPGHSRKDRGLSIRDNATGDDVVLHCFNDTGFDWRGFKDELRHNRLLPSRERTSPHKPVARVDRPPVSTVADTSRSASALRLWAQSIDPAGTLVEAYLASRGLQLPGEPVEVLRFHPSCPFGEGQRRPCMVALMRDVLTDEPVAIHRTALTADARKLDRKMMGPTRGAAIKLGWEVTAGLGVAEGVETALSVMAAGWSPVWALGSAGAISTMPVLPYITLTVFADADNAGQAAAAALAERYVATGRDTFIQTPAHGDFNDILKGSTNA